MRTIWLVMALWTVFLTGCAHRDDAPPPAAKSAVITIGMSIETAKSLLEAHGGEEVGLATAPPEGKSLLNVSLPGNRLAIIVYDPEDENRITAMSVCTNPEAVRVEQDWHAVDEIELGPAQGTDE